MESTVQPLGRALITLGILFIVVGGLLLLLPKGSWLGRLPGDIAIRRDNFSFYLPLTTCLLLSGLLSVILWLMGRFHR